MEEEKNTAHLVSLHIFGNCSLMKCYSHDPDGMVVAVNICKHSGDALMSYLMLLRQYVIKILLISITHCITH